METNRKILQILPAPIGMKVTITLRWQQKPETVPVVALALVRRDEGDGYIFESIEPCIWHEEMGGIFLPVEDVHSQIERVDVIYS